MKNILRFNFSNYILPFKLNANYQRHSHHFDFPQELFGNSIIPNLQTAFNQVQEAIVEQDHSFIKENCEKRLSTLIISRLNHLQQANYSLHIAGEQQLNQIVQIQDVNFNMGVHFNRQDNQKLNAISTREINPMAHIKIMISFPGNPSLKPIIQLVCVFPCQYIIQLKHQDKIIEEGKLNSHKVIFETLHSEPYYNLGKMAGLIQIMGSQEKLAENLKEFITENFEWKISDIDDNLNGNSFV